MWLCSVGFHNSAGCILIHLIARQAPAIGHRLHGIQELSLFNNRLTTLPAELALLKSLVVLSLDYNQLTEVTRSLSQFE